MKIVKVNFTKGITVSKNYQAVRYDIGLEGEVEIDTEAKAAGVSLKRALGRMEEMVNKELRRLKLEAENGTALVK